MDIGDFHLMEEEAEFERRIAMNWDRDAFNVTRFLKNVMATVSAFVKPAFLLEKSGKILSGDLFHGGSFAQGARP